MLDNKPLQYQIYGLSHRAYVLAHEFAHHVQALLGITNSLNDFDLKPKSKELMALEVMHELQADAFAGYWLQHIYKTTKVFTETDIQLIFDTVSKIGGKGHGTSEQRLEWFKKGFKATHFDELNPFLDSGLQKDLDHYTIELLKIFFEPMSYLHGSAIE